MCQPYIESATALSDIHTTVFYFGFVVVFSFQVYISETYKNNGASSPDSMEQNSIYNNNNNNINNYNKMSKIEFPLSGHLVFKGCPC